MFSVTHFHPMLVHFPIALIVIGFLADLFALSYKKEACLSKCGFYLLIVGTVSALAAVLSGVFFTEEMGGDAGTIRETHEVFAILTLCILVVTCVLKILLNTSEKENKNLKWVVFALYGTAVLFVCATGFFGGNLVYNYIISAQ